MTAAERMRKSYGSLTCLALIKPNSNIARNWALRKPSYCILEYSPTFEDVQIHWSDGSREHLVEAEQLDELVLLAKFKNGEVARLFE